MAKGPRSSQAPVLDLHHLFQLRLSSLQWQKRLRSHRLEALFCFQSRISISIYAKIATYHYDTSKKASEMGPKSPLALRRSSFSAFYGTEDSSRSRSPALSLKIC